MKTTINSEAPGDRVNYRSPDGLVTIVTKVASAKRWPQHDYPIVCLQLRPQQGSRVQEIEGGSGALDVLLNHEEVARHIRALSEADPKAGYRVPHIPLKSADRKARWDAINRKRRQNGGKS